MPKASADHSIAAPASLRRGLLAGFLALPAVVAPLALGNAAGADPDAALAAPLPHPDAELIATCERHSALTDAANAEEIEDGPAWLAYSASRDAISEAQPQTLAGMRAKALAAKSDARTPDGSENPDGTMAETWAWDLVNDLLRLTGGPA
jgi:hypothetical protein